jgi:UDP-glucose 4-epimerase
MTVLVTGGAGYIGAHVVRLLQRAGRDVLVVDDLSTGREARLGGAELVVVDVADTSSVGALTEAMSAHQVRQVVHFAARKRVDESVRRPAWYYQQNVTGLANVLTAMEAAGADQLVFSSSAAVYGDTHESSVGEGSPTVPVNPYGETKLAGEWLMRAAARAGILRGVSLRYFNVAGSGWDDLGDPAVLNLVTMVLDRLTRGESPRVFGTDYATPDGTCVRDFVHVLDLARAHVAALERTAQAPLGSATVLNVGTGQGTSVAEVVHALARITGVDVDVIHEPRRAGDPPSVVAAVDRISSELGWRAQEDLESILTSAWSAWRTVPPRTTDAAVR